MFSCGTVALDGPLFFWRTIGLRISPYQKFAELRPRIRRTFQHVDKGAKGIQSRNFKIAYFERIHNFYFSFDINAVFFSKVM
jgi:hypothetical protein